MNKTVPRFEDVLNAACQKDSPRLSESEFIDFVIATKRSHGAFIADLLDDKLFAYAENKIDIAEVIDDIANLVSTLKYLDNE